MVHINFKLSKEELTKGLVASSRSRFVTKLFRITGSILLAALVFFITATLVKGTFKFSGGMIIVFLLAVQQYFLAEISALIQAPALIKSKNAVTQQIDAKMGRNGITLKGEDFQNQLPWEKHHSVIETHDFFLVKPTEGSANILPKRAFKEEEIAELKAILHSVDGLKIKLLP